MLRVFGQGISVGVGFSFTFEDWNLFDSSELWRKVSIGSPEERLAKIRDPENRKALVAEYEQKKGPSPCKLGSESFLATRWATIVPCRHIFAP